MLRRRVPDYWTQKKSPGSQRNQTACPGEPGPSVFGKGTGEAPAGLACQLQLEDTEGQSIFKLPKVKNTHRRNVGIHVQIGSSQQPTKTSTGDAFRRGYLLSGLRPGLRGQALKVANVSREGVVGLHGRRPLAPWESFRPDTGGAVLPVASLVPHTNSIQKNGKPLSARPTEAETSGWEQAGGDGVCHDGRNGAALPSPASSPSFSLFSPGTHAFPLCSKSLGASGGPRGEDSTGPVSPGV